ncbi:MAG: Glu-tRNA(Gln) amidotransferase subunit GatE [Thermoplasmatales archaeon]|nr:Glu-tRNA(Gln) amidotransferase subunit GatE [Thermoplasmatales archaeon]
MDYKSLGFKAGLEIHQQIDTHKLFCPCPSELSEKAEETFSRKLKATKSETGLTDKAAIEEEKKGRKFIYYITPSSCLVEADEEPPHEVNQEAIDFAIMVAIMFGATIFDEIHFMRKIVIDGSNTTGFQRTALIAMNGKVGDVNIETICIEEDAARKIEENEREVKYSLDRLGIPLIEIATSPTISSPLEAKEIAEKIGLMLRATKKVKRGIGTIRQDLNVSIEGGARVEIKGVQELNDIPKILENEVKRQIELIEVSKRLKNLSFDFEIKDVTKVFENTSSNFIKKAIEKGFVKAIKLPGFKGILSGVIYKEHRLGKELAMHAKINGGGIIHSDELPNYGISEEEVLKIREELKCGENDAFVISAGNAENVEKCLRAVFERAKKACEGVPKEVRKAIPDGTSEYMRPLPGAERMYPETDIRPIRISRERIEKIKRAMPEMPDKKIDRIFSSYKLTKEEASQLVMLEKDEIFEEIAKKFGQEKIVSRILLNIIPQIEKDGYEVSKEMIEIVLKGLNEKKYAKEGIEKLLAYLAKNREANLDSAIKACGLGYLSDEEVREFIKKVIIERIEFIKEKGENAIQPLMGILMAHLRGRADGATINRILKEEVEKIIYKR